MDNDSLQELWTKTVTMLKEAGQEDPSQSIRPVTFSASHKAKLKDLPTIDLADHKRGQSEDGENLSEDKTLPITKSKRLAKQRTPLSGFDMYTEIGRGGMGTVYRGRQRSLDRDVALKQLLERHESEEFRQSFVTEARVTGWLDHPNIVPVYDFSQSLEGDPLFAMKLIHGTSWNETLNELKVGEQLEKQLKVLVAVCNGVAFAHSRSIVHCDLKPENIMVGDFGEVLVMDWGLALNVAPHDQEGEQNRARHKLELKEPSGTPFYMPPELAEGRGKGVGVWTDIYLLGGILYRILSGKPPHNGDSLMAVIEVASKSEPPDFADDCPDELKNTCRRSLSKDPKDRHETVLEFQRELQNFLEHRESTQISDTAGLLLNSCIKRSNDPKDKDSDQLYADFAETVAAFKQAHMLWAENVDAQEGGQRAREFYARSALEHGDLGLAATQASRLDSGRASAREILKLIKKRRKEEIKSIRSAQFAKIALLAALLLLFSGLVGTVVFFNQQTNTERELRKKVQQAKAKEESARGRAEEAAQKADRALKSEKQARLRSQTLQADAEEARSEALSEREVAVNLKLEAERRRDESQKLLAYAYYEQAERCRTESDFLAAEALYAKSLSIQERRDIRELIQSARFQSATRLWTSPRPFGGVQIQFRPDYKQFATLDNEGRLHLWDTAQQVLIETLSLSRESIISFSYSFNSKTLAVSGSNGSLVVFNLIEGKRVKQGKVHRSTATFVRFTPDGSKFITAGLSGNVKVWDNQSGQRLYSVQAHIGFINDLAISPDSQKLISVGYDSKLHVLDIASQKVEESPLPSMVVDIGFDPGGNYLLLLGVNRGWLHELATKKNYPLSSGRDAAYTHAFSADGRLLALGHPTHISLWDFKTRKKIKDNIKFPKRVNKSAINHHSFAFDKAGENLYVLGGKTPLQVCNIAQNKTSLHLDGHRVPIVKARFSPDGHMVASLDRGGSLRLWKRSTGFCFAKLQTDGSYFEWSRDGRQLIVARNAGRIRGLRRLAGQSHSSIDIWDVDKQKKVQSLVINESLSRFSKYPRTLAMTVSPDGKKLATGHDDWSVRFWDLKEGKEELRINSRFSAVVDLVFSFDGRLLALAGRDRSVEIWDVQTLKRLQTLKHDEPLTCVAFHPNKEELSVGTKSGRVWIWDWKRDDPLLTLSIHDKAVTDVSYRPDGLILAVAGDDSKIRLIDLKSGKQVLALRCHERSTRTVDFSPSGAQLLSGGADQTVQLWALARPYDFSIHRPFRRRVVDFSIAPDSATIVALGERGQLQSWKLDGSLTAKRMKVRQYISRHLALSPDGNMVAVAGNAGVSLLDLSAEKKSPTNAALATKSQAMGLAFDGQKSRLYVVINKRDRHEIQVWEPKQRKRLKTFESAQGTMAKWAMSPTSKHFITVNHAGWLYLWNCSTGRLEKRLRVQRRNVLSLAFRPDGRQIAIAGRDQALSLWSIPDGRLLTRVRSIRNHIYKLTYHPGGRWLAMVTYSNELKLWDLKTNKVRVTMALNSSSATITPVNLHFTPDGQRLVASGPDNSIKVWRFSTLLSVAMDSKKLYEESRRRTGLRADNLRLEKTVSNRLVPFTP
jgi:WD40 repeat protein/serine/threonine protein kinase